MHPCVTVWVGRRYPADASKRRVVLSVAAIVGACWEDRGGIAEEAATETAIQAVETAMRIEARAASILDTVLEPDLESGPSPGWYADPFGRFAYRFWDGTWTSFVSTGGRTYQDSPD